jgi:hypothetical protein
MKRLNRSSLPASVNLIMVVSALMVGVAGMESIAIGSTATTIYGTNTPGAVGDPGSFMLLPQSVYFNLMHNDFAGDTDKHLTGSAWTGISLLDPIEKRAFDIRLEWRFITPAFQGRFDQADYDKPVGRFADWLALDSSYAFTRPLNSGWEIRHQLAFGLGHIGSKGARQVQTAIHKQIAVAYENLIYSDQPVGWHSMLGYEASLISPASNKYGVTNLRTLMTGGVSTDVMVDEIYLRLNTVGDLGSQIGVSLELAAFQQLGSEMLRDLSGIRYEAGLGAIVWQIYRPGIKYVSNFLNSDRVGQLYIDPINISIPF